MKLQAYITFLLLNLSFYAGVHAQKHSSEIVFTDHMNTRQKGKINEYKIKTGHPATAVVFGVSGLGSFEDAYLITQTDTIQLSNDEHGDASSLMTYSNLVSFDTPLESFLFSPGSILNKISIFPIDARMPEEIEKANSTKKKSADCSEPEMIDQLVWRAGLTPPNYTRIETDVRNLIIHHTAGSNTDTNYVQVVRNIYIYHTEVRGWSDIGYNYLIAQNGTIFKGRDPEMLDQDNVLGAHFCASNSHTMGVSLLGTYTDIAPSDTTIASLISLLTWKAGKDSLNPLGESPHALNFNLDVIAGHRNGCATECPGTEAYKLLAFVRNEVSERFQGCDFFIKPLGVELTYLPELKVRKLHSSIEISGLLISEGQIRIYNTLGQTVGFELLDSTPDKIILKPYTASGTTLVVSVEYKGKRQAKLIHY